MLDKLKVVKDVIFHIFKIKILIDLHKIFKSKWQLWVDVNFKKVLKSKNPIK